jgi:hypothetical protein
MRKKSQRMLHQTQAAATSIEAKCAALFTGASAQAPKLPCEPVTGSLNAGVQSVTCCNAWSIRSAVNVLSQLPMASATIAAGLGVNRCHALASNGGCESSGPLAGIQPVASTTVGAATTICENSSQCMQV